MYTHVVIKNSRQYTNNDCNVKSIHTTYDKALLNGWKYIITDCLKPYNLKFYKNRKDEFANCIGIADYYIEKWTIDSDIEGLSDKWYLGFKNKPYNNHFDKYLKNLVENKQDIKTILEDWMTYMEDNSSVPTIMQDMTFK